MAARTRIEDESRLSTHSSLQEEDIDLDKERRRKLAKEGVHRIGEGNTLNLKGATRAITIAGSKEQKYSLASALKIAGGVAIIGTAWTSIKELDTKTKAAKDMQAVALVANAAAKAKIYKLYKDDRKTVTAALKLAGAVVIAASSWTPKERANPVMANTVLTAQAATKPKARKKRDMSKTIAGGLRIAGAVAIAGASWSKPLPADKVEETSNGLSMAGIVTAATLIEKSKKRKRRPKHSIMNGLRVAGGVAIAAASWMPQETIRDESMSPIELVLSAEPCSTGGSPAAYTPKITLVDMATSPIPQEVAESTPRLPQELTPIPGALPVVMRVIEPTPSPDIPRQLTAETPLTTPPPSVIANRVAPATAAVTPEPSVPPNLPVTPAVIVQPIRTPEVARQAATPQPQQIIVQPQPIVSQPQPSLVAGNIVRKQNRSPTPQPKEETKPPTTRPPTTKPPTPPGNVIEEEIPIIAEESATVTQVGTGKANAPKPQRKALAQLTPLERFAARTKSLL